MLIFINDIFPLLIFVINYFQFENGKFIRAVLLKAVSLFVIVKFSESASAIELFSSVSQSIISGGVIFSISLIVIGLQYFIYNRVRSGIAYILTYAVVETICLVVLSSLNIIQLF